jgi:hypothetical protein
MAENRNSCDESAFAEVNMSVSPLLAFHIAGGTVGVLSGFAAVSVRKGSRWHGILGNVFFVSILGMSAAGVYLALVKSQMGNVFGGTLTFYLVATAWVTARRKDGGAGVPSFIAMLVALGVGLVIVSFGVQAARSGGTRDGVPAGAYFFLGSIALLSMAGDARVLFQGGITGSRRISRHLWRMCFALFIASGSVFTARAQFFPAIMRRTGALMALTMLPLLLMIYWLIRMRIRKTPARNWVPSGATSAVRSPAM